MAMERTKARMARQPSTPARPLGGTRRCAPRIHSLGSMDPVVASALIALAIVALLRRPWVFSPALVIEPIAEAALAPGDEDEQLPETDRAPRWLPWTVAAVAALRVGPLVPLRARQGRAACLPPGDRRVSSRA